MLLFLLCLVFFFIILIDNGEDKPYLIMLRSQSLNSIEMNDAFDENYALNIYKINTKYVSYFTIIVGKNGRFIYIRDT